MRVPLGTSTVAAAFGAGGFAGAGVVAGAAVVAGAGVGDAGIGAAPDAGATGEAGAGGGADAEAGGGACFSAGGIGPSACCACAGIADISPTAIKAAPRNSGRRSLMRCLPTCFSRDALPGRRDASEHKPSPFARQEPLLSYPASACGRPPVSTSVRLRHPGPSAGTPAVILE